MVLAGDSTKNSDDVSVHIDTFSAMNGISRFCENEQPWRSLSIFNFCYFSEQK